MIEYFSPSSHTLTTSPAPRGDTDEEEAFITNIYSNDFLFCFLHFTWETGKLKKAHKCHVTYFLCLLFLLNNTRKVYALLFNFVKNAFCALKHFNDNSQRFFCHQTHENAVTHQCWDQGSQSSVVFWSTSVSLETTRIQVLLNCWVETSSNTSSPHFFTSSDDISCCKTADKLS